MNFREHRCAWLLAFLVAAIHVFPQLYFMTQNKSYQGLPFQGIDAEEH